MVELQWLPKLLLQHDESPISVLENVGGAFLQAVQQRAVQASISPSGDGLAVALGQRLVVLNGLGTGSPAVEFVSAVEAPEAVTALCWLAAGAPSADECLLLATSAGHLQLHSAATGALLLRQQLHHSAAVAAAVRWSGTGIDPEDLSEDVSVTFTDAVVRLPGWEVWAAVRWHAGRAARGGGSWWGGGGSAVVAAASPHQLSFSKFSLPKGAGPRSHAMCLGPPPPTLYAGLNGRQQTPRLQILTAGSAPPLAAYEAEESATPGLLSFVSDLASSTAQSLLGRARAYVPSPGRSLLGGLRRGSSGVSSAGGGSGGGANSSSTQQQQGKREKIPGEPASLAAAVWDEKRSITQMAMSPCGRWAACCDNFGRMLLVDAASTLVLRMLKGYRDAQVAWLVCDSADGGSGGGGPVSSGLYAAAGVAALGSSSSLGSLAPGSLRGSEVDLTALQQQQAVAGGDGHQRPTLEPAGAQQPEAPPLPSPLPARQQPGRRQGRWQGRQQLLVVYAPRRAVVELWEPHSLTRLGSVRCSTQQGLLLQQPARRAAGGAAGASSSTHLAANNVLLLDATALTLFDLTAPLAALV